jgi:hypothetical protein
MSVESQPKFRGTYCHHLQDRRISQARNQRKASAAIEEREVWTDSKEDIMGSKKGKIIPRD